MKKRLLSFALAGLLAFASPVTALAESLSGGDGWAVTYTTAGTLSDTYSAAEYADQVSGLQPGDDITFTVTLNHQNATPADWYLSNEVVKSLEEGAATGSAYEYLLTYQGPGSSRTLYDSVAVGGDDSEGLAEATDALDDYIALQQLKQGESATVTLKVTLDGETEGNDYFNTLARLKLKFAVEPEPAPVERVEHKTENKTVTRTVVATGDEQRLFPFYVAMVVSGVAFLALAVQSVRIRKQEKQEGIR